MTKRSMAGAAATALLATGYLAAVTGTAHGAGSPRSFVPPQDSRQALHIARAKAIPQQITVEAPPPRQTEVLDSSEIRATGGGSGNPVRFSLDRVTFDACVLTDHGDSTATVQYQHPGDCFILATQEGSSTYRPARELFKVHVFKYQQSVRFTSEPPPQPRLVGDTYRVSGEGSPTGQPLLFIVGGNGPHCVVSDVVQTPPTAAATVTFTSPGKCTINLRQQTNDDFGFEVTQPPQRQKFSIQQP